MRCNTVRNVSRTVHCTAICKSLPDTRTYPFVLHPRELIRKQPKMATRHKTVKPESKRKDGSEIQAPKGKLGVMIPGMGAVATTFVAGVEAVRKGFATPIGSLTQMGTVRLGRRTESRAPKVNEFVPLARLNDLVFTGCYIFEDDMYAAACNARLLERGLLALVNPFRRLTHQR